MMRSNDMRSRGELSKQVVVERFEERETEYHTLSIHVLLECLYKLPEVYFDVQLSRFVMLPVINKQMLMCPKCVLLLSLCYIISDGFSNSKLMTFKYCERW